MIKMLEDNKKRAHHFVKIIIFILLVLCAGKFLLGCENNEKNGMDNQNVISFTGHGEVSAVPDIANIIFSIQKDANTVKEAQDGVAQVEKKSLDFLKTNNVADKDIKTTDAFFNPKYEYQYEKQTCAGFNCPPPIGKNVIVGYTASESITVKIRNTDDAGKIMQGLGELGVSNLNGPNFAIDKEDALKDSARKLAIDDAKTKAQKLAIDLGIHLGKITSFNENANYPVPMYDRMNTVASKAEVTVPAVIPTGENLITSDVTITYEIK